MSGVESQVSAGSAKTKEQLKAERKAAHEAQLAEKLKQAKENKAKMSKAERRALQDSQRAAKSEKGGPTPEVKSKQHSQKPNVNGSKDNKSDETPKKAPVIAVPPVMTKVTINVPPNSIVSNERTPKINLAKNLKPTTASTKSKKTQIFPDIPCRQQKLDILLAVLPTDDGVIHPHVVRAGLLINSGKVTGSTKRCIIMLTCFKFVIDEYKTPQNKRLSRDLKEKLDKSVSFLDRCRPLSVSMRNAIKALNMFLTKIKPDEEDGKAKESITTYIDNFIEEEIKLALDGIEAYGASKINQSGDVILTFSSSLTVMRVLSKAWQQKKNFRVIVVDARPRYPSKDIARFLLAKGVHVTYIFINAVAYVMKEVTKVFLGAHTILANGYVMAKMGCSQVALVARAYNVPVLVCCETYKFSERVHTDCFSSNESGRDGERSILETRIASPGSRDVPKLRPDYFQILDLIYDVTPPDFVSLVITEKGILPCSSVPAVIRRNVSKLQ